MTPIRIARPRLALLCAGLVLALLGSLNPAQDGALAGGDGSGGKAVAHRAGGDPVQGARPGPDARLHRIFVDKAPIAAGEPTLGVTNEGNVFYTAIQSNTRIEIMRS